MKLVYICCGLVMAMAFNAADVEREIRDFINAEMATLLGPELYVENIPGPSLFIVYADNMGIESLKTLVRECLDTALKGDVPISELVCKEHKTDKLVNIHCVFSELCTLQIMEFRSGDEYFRVIDQFMQSPCVELQFFFKEAANKSVLAILRNGVQLLSKEGGSMVVDADKRIMNYVMKYPLSDLFNLFKLSVLDESALYFQSRQTVETGDYVTLNLYVCTVDGQRQKYSVIFQRKDGIDSSHIKFTGPPLVSIDPAGSLTACAAQLVRRCSALERRLQLI